jgi:hypothetical protein
VSLTGWWGEISVYELEQLVKRRSGLFRLRAPAGTSAAADRGRPTGTSGAGVLAAGLV